MKFGLTERCALCLEEWVNTKNSNEHIIPEAIGGRKTVSGFICEACNNKTGASWDAEISRQFSVVSNMVGVRRQKGKGPSVRIENSEFENLFLNLDGSFNVRERPRPVESFDINSQIGHVGFKAGSHEQADTIIEGLKKKYDKQGYSNVSFTKKDSDSFLSEPVKVSLNFSGEKAGRSLVKTALALAYHNGVEPELCDSAMDYLTGSGKPCFGYLYTKDLLSSRPKEVIHCVSVKGLPANGVLLGYVEYFSLMRVVVCLSDCYTGVEFSDTYALDPTSGALLDIDVDLDFDKANLNDIFEFKYYCNDVLRECLLKVGGFVSARSSRQQMHREVEKAYVQALLDLKLEEGQELNNAQCKALSSRITGLLMPYIEREVFRGRSATTQN